MKRSVKLLCSLLAALMLCAALGACTPVSTDSPVGFYKIRSIDGKSVNDYFTAEAEKSGLDLDGLRAMFALLGFTGELEEYITIELMEDGKCDLGVSLEEPELGTWKIEGSTVTIIDAEGEAQTLEYKNGTLTGLLEEVPYVFYRTEKPAQ